MLLHLMHGEESAPAKRVDQRGFNAAPGQERKSARSGIPRALSPKTVIVII